jgi:hypothetical protein
MVFKNKEWITTEKDIEKLLQLKKENPEMEILFMVNDDVVCSDEFNYYKGSFEEIEKSFYVEINEFIYTNKDDLLDYLYFKFDQEEIETNDEYEKRIAEKFNEIHQEEKIIIWVGV